MVNNNDLNHDIKPVIWKEKIWNLDQIFFMKTKKVILWIMPKMTTMVAAKGA